MKYCCLRDWESKIDKWAYGQWLWKVLWAISLKYGWAGWKGNGNDLCKQWKHTRLHAVFLIWFKYRVFLQFLSTACMFEIHQFLVSCHVQMFCNQRLWYFFLQCLRQNSFTCRLGKCGGLAFFTRRIHKSHRNCCCCCCHFCDRSWWTRCSNSCLKKTWKFSLALSI